MAHLSPMSRLLIMAGLTSIGTDVVHFIDADRAIFSYPSEQPPPPPENQHHQQSINAASTTPAHLRAAENGRDTGDGKKEDETVDRDMEAELGQPPPGQVGLLQFNPAGRGTEFILSLDQSLPDRLTLSAEVETLDGEGGGEESAAVSGGVRRGGLQAGGEAGSGSGGGGGGGGGGQEGGRDASGSVCVKYLSTVGTAPVQRIDWFPRREDALSMRRAIDAYCPIPWLRDGGGLGSIRGEDEAVAGGGGEGGEEGGHGRYRRIIEAAGGGEGGEGGEGGRVRRLLLYQRDQNRKMVHVEQVRNNGVRSDSCIRYRMVSK